MYNLVILVLAYCYIRCYRSSSGILAFHTRTKIYPRDYLPVFFFQDSTLRSCTSTTFRIARLIRARGSWYFFIRYIYIYIYIFVEHIATLCTSQIVSARTRVDSFKIKTIIGFDISRERHVLKSKHFFLRSLRESQRLYQARYQEHLLRWTQNVYLHL